ncbi:MAG: hypothetical protein LBK41_00955 [Clostridiales bacterium]|nr:hypothetical protein [Clostridiales bacterium]
MITDASGDQIPFARAAIASGSSLSFDTALEQITANVDGLYDVRYQVSGTPTGTTTSLSTYVALDGTQVDYSVVTATYVPGVAQTVSGETILGAHAGQIIGLYASAPITLIQSTVSFTISRIGD